MIISINAGKVFSKIQHLLTRRTTQRAMSTRELPQSNQRYLLRSSEPTSYLMVLGGNKTRNRTKSMVQHYSCKIKHRYPPPTLFETSSLEFHHEEKNPLASVRKDQFPGFRMQTYRHSQQ